MAALTVAGHLPRARPPHHRLAVPPPLPRRRRRVHRHPGRRQAGHADRRRRPDPARGRRRRRRCWGRLDNLYFMAAIAPFLYFGVVGWFDDALKVRFKSSLFGLGPDRQDGPAARLHRAVRLWLVSAASPLPAAVRTQLFLPFVKAPLVEMGPVVVRRLGGLRVLLRSSTRSTSPTGWTAWSPGPPP